MAITALGKKLRMLRLDRGEVMKDMANHLQVSSAYLSAIERGKKAPSEKIISGIKKYYSLDADEAQALQQAVSLSQTSINIDLHGANDEERMLATAFARKFKSLEDFEKNQLTKLLHEG